MTGRWQGDWEPELLSATPAEGQGKEPQKVGQVVAAVKGRGSRAKAPKLKPERSVWEQTPNQDAGKGLISKSPVTIQGAGGKGEEDGSDMVGPCREKAH